MIWLTTICLLVLLAHLLREAFYEKRLYEDTVEDVAAAADEGLFMDAVRRNRIESEDGYVPISDDSSALGRAVSMVKTRGAKIDNFIDSKASQAVQQKDSPDMFDRSVDKVRNSLDKAEQKLNQTVYKNRGDNANEDGKTMITEDTLLARYAAKVHDLGSSFDEKLRTKLSRQANSEPDSGFFNKAVSKVASKMDQPEPSLFDSVTNRVSSRFSDEKPRANPDKEDFVFRAASRVGKKLESVEDRLFSGNKH